MTPSNSPAPVAFKEWAVICGLLGRGEQSIILRKGGIAEGRGGFQFREREFFLFPTLFHEQIARTRLDPATPLPRDEAAAEGQIAIRYFARADIACEITDPDALARLAPFHYWSEETVRERFEWGRGRSIKLALVRVFRLNPVWIIEDRPEFGGCKSWIDLPAPPETFVLEPVLSDAEHAARRAAIEAALGAALEEPAHAPA